MDGERVAGRKIKVIKQNALYCTEVKLLVTISQKASQNTLLSPIWSSLHFNDLIRRYKLQVEPMVMGDGGGGGGARGGGDRDRGDRDRGDRDRSRR